MLIGTHNGTMHADEVFAIAAILLLYPDANVIRTRDLDLLAECDIRVDVGGKYDPSSFDFDHHQQIEGGTRGNGIKYSAFGLVWKRFGEEICGNGEVARMIDRKLVAPIDAIDNGQKLVGENGPFNGVSPFDISLVVNKFNPTWDEEPEHDECFQRAVAFARGFLLRLIKHDQAIIAAREPVRLAAKNAADKRVVVMDRFVPWKWVLVTETKALYVIFRGSEGRWRVECVTTSMGSFEKRKPLPAAWAGKVDAEFAAITGVADARFCHKELFVCGADSREGALALARLALEA